MVSNEGFDSSGNSYPTIKHSLVNELIMINKYHFLHVLDNMEKQKPKAPHFEHVMIPLGIFLAVLIPLYTSEFKDSLGMKAAVWQSFTFMLAALAAVSTLVLFAWWLKNCLCYKQKSNLEIVNEVIDQMERDKERSASEIQSRGDSK